MTVGQILAKCKQELVGLDRQITILDAEILLAFVLGEHRSRMLAYLELNLTDDQQALFYRFWYRRCRLEPLAYITANKEFFELDFVVTDDVLIPRPDSELLVEVALSLDLSDASVLDLGTGSGALVCVMAKLREHWHFIASDVSLKALDIARINMVHHDLEDRVELVHSDWFDNIAEQHFDLIVCNPPYIAYGDTELDYDGCQHEPDVALFAGTDGLSSYRNIFLQMGRYCHSSTCIVLEHGYAQASAVARLAKDNGFLVASKYSDMAGLPRALLCYPLSKEQQDYL